MVQIVVDARDIDKDYPVDHAVVGDAKLVLQQLISEVKASLARPVGVAARSPTRSRTRRTRTSTSGCPPDIARVPDQPVPRDLDMMNTVDRKNTI